MLPLSLYIMQATMYLIGSCICFNRKIGESYVSMMAAIFSSSELDTESSSMGSMLESKKRT